MPNTLDVYVSPTGNDKHSGTLQRPVATAERGLTLLRQKRKAAKSPVTARLVFRGGVHALRKPIVLTPKDSGAVELTGTQEIVVQETPLILTSHEGEHATLSGGRRITGWREGEANGRPCWVADLPQVRRGQWNFAQLWVNGRRATRTRLPRQGLFQIEKLLDPLGDPKKSGQGIFVGQKRFTYRDGDLAAFHNLEDVEFVALHFWIESRVPIVKLDAKKRRVELAWAPRLQLTDDYAGGGAFYYVENVLEALGEPGEWYLDRPAGKLYYLPRPGERIDEIDAVAPVLDQLIRLEGDPAGEKLVEHVRIENLTLSHNEYVPDEAARKAAPQAACHVPGAVAMHGAKGCVIDRCTLEHVGSYGVEMIDGCVDCAVTRCELRDLAAGGVKVFHAVLDEGGGADKIRGRGKLTRGCRRIVIADNHIHDGGYRFRQAVGVLVGRCSGVQVLHNHIHDLDYSGISVGWTWGYAESHAYGNIIEWNHIHDIGRGALSDMGGIYTLGVQPGTRIRFNHIHDVESRGYGGWGIYPDEGSSYMLIENNLVHRTKYAGFYCHYGRQNTVRNNIFAFGRLESVALGRFENHTAFVFERNIVLTEQPKLFSAPYNDPSGAPMPAEFDHNLYWCTAGCDPDFGGRTWSQWRDTGRDAHSAIGDPKFRDPKNGDFTLKFDSPAILTLGFVLFDLSTVGPRGHVGAVPR